MSATSTDGNDQMKEPPYITPLHAEVEAQIGRLSKAPFDPGWMALAHRCSQIIKGFEERIATGELSVRRDGPSSDASDLMRDILNLPANAQQLELLDRGIGTATEFAVLLRARKYIEGHDATGSGS